MRISATVEVSNRLLPSLNMGRKRPERSYLSIGYLGQKEKVFILHQTLRNGAGVKYKVNGNILALFMKFISDGKATMRFKEPPVDLIIKGEPQQLKNFFQVLNQFLEKKIPHKMLQLSNLAAATTKVASKPSVKLVIKDKKDMISFSRTLEVLQINQVTMKKLDCRILRLQKLKVLNLEDNLLEDIPNEIDLIPTLEELCLAKNKIGESSNFSWLCSHSLRSHLTHLDLRENSIKHIPQEICRLRCLKTLKLDNNQLKRLPNGLGLLSKLKKLSVSDNKLEWLPGSCQFLRLDSIDVSCNNWTGKNKNGNRNRVVTLVDLAAVVVLQYRLHFSEELIPRTLVCYLEDAGYCSCGLPVFPSNPDKFAGLCHIPAVERVIAVGELPVIGFSSCILHATRVHNVLPF